MLPFKNLLRRKVRSLFAVLQIAVAIAAFVSIVGVTQGLRAQFYRLGQVFAYDVMIQPKGVASPLFAAIQPGEAAAVAQVPGVGAVSRMGVFATLPPGRAQPLTVLALEPGGELIARYPIVAGRTLRPDDPPGVLVGRLMAEEMGLRVGSTLRLAEFEWEVLGIFEPPIQDVPFLSGQALIDLAQFQARFKIPPQILVAHTAPGQRAGTPDEVKRAIARCREVVGPIEAALPRMKARTISDFLDSFKQVELIDSFLLAITFLSALVSGIGVANTMLMSVFDRTREIGLLRAIGWSRGRIVGMIQAEGLLLALAGGLVGLPLGSSFILAAQALVRLGWLQVSLDPRLYAQALAIAATIGLLSSLYPAMRAAWLEPTEALRYE